MSLYHKNLNAAQRAVQNSNINYIHVETPQTENNNNDDYMQIRSQKTNKTEHNVCIA